MAIHREIEYPNISVEEIEAGVRRARALRALYFRDVGRRVIAALRSSHRSEGGHGHGGMLAHGC